MAKAAQSPDLTAGFERHLEESEVHVERLEQVFDLIGKPARERLRQNQTRHPGRNPRHRHKGRKTRQRFSLCPQIFDGEFDFK